MYDASKDAMGDPELVPVQTSVTPTSSGATVALTPDHDFLSDPSTTYPVIVDPSWTAAPSGDTYVTTTNPTTNFGDSDELRVGTPNAGANKARSFIRFNTGVAPWNEATIQSANLTMNNFASSVCAGGVVRVYRLTEQFYATGATWDNQPAATTWRATDSNVAKGATGCAAGDVSWDVTDITQVWADGTAEPHGFRVSGVDETNTNTWRRHRSANAATDKPRLNVTYRPHISIAPASGSTFWSGTATTFDTATPRFSTRVSSTSSRPVKVRYTLSTADGQVWRSPALTPASGVATAQVPAWFIETALTYTVSAEASDGVNDTARLASPDLRVAGAATVSPSPAAPNIPDALTISPCLDGCMDPYWRYTTSGTPTLSAITTDADNNSLRYFWQLRAAGEDEILGYAVSGGASGATSSWTVPTGLLENDQQYEFHVGRCQAV